jgi:protein phosphatase PTC7
MQSAKVAEPTSSPISLPPSLTQPPLSWAFAVGLITISIAALSLSKNIFSASLKLNKKSLSSSSAAPLSSSEAAAVAAVGPLLLAAETAAQVDETIHLSMNELEKLDLNLRMLITNMDAQLLELQDDLAVLLPPAAVDAWDEITFKIAEIEDQIATVESGSDAAAALEEKLMKLQWEIFSVLQPHAHDESKRSYRSLLYNRGVQSQLLRQVEKQVALRTKMQQVKSQLHALEEQGGKEENGQDLNKQTTVSGKSASSIENNNNNNNNNKNLSLTVAGCAIPHPAKLHTGGEDAFFVSEEYASFGVADGVGGWAAAGIDPAEYPRKLIDACEIGAALHGDPYDILMNAFETVHAPGTCTVALATLEGNYLHLASLGDCGTRIVRDGTVIFASKVQEHRFNQPYQLGSPRFHPSNVPEDAHRYSIVVQPGDVIVMGSDGLWDNLWDHELESLVAEELEKMAAVVGARGGGDGISRHYKGQEKVQELVDNLAKLASKHSKDSRYSSPFVVEKYERLVPEAVRKLMEEEPQGGKLDDVTAVAAIIY